MPLKKLILFSNGNSLAFDESGEQISTVQSKGWLHVYLEHLVGLGIDPTKILIETKINGEYQRILPFETEYGWNADFVASETFKS